MIVIAYRAPATRTVASLPESVVLMPEIGSVAEIVATPGVRASTRLRLPGVLGADTTTGALDAYTTRCVRLRVKPPVKCPVTVKLSLLPRRRATPCGDMVSFSSGHCTVSVALPSASDIAPVAGSTAEMTAVPGPAALAKAPPGEPGLPPTTATVSSLDRQSTRAVQSSLPPVSRYAVAVNCARSPAIAVSVCGDTRSATPGSPGSSGGRVGPPGSEGGAGSDGCPVGGAGGAGSAGAP